MKIVSYSYDDIQNIMEALDKIQTSGIEQARIIVYISNILSKGEIKNRYDSEKEGGAT